MYTAPCNTGFDTVLIPGTQNATCAPMRCSAPHDIQNSQREMKIGLQYPELAPQPVEYGFDCFSQIVA